MVALYIIIPLVLLSFLVGIYRKGKIQGEVKNSYEEFLEERDFYIEWLLRISENKSFKILKEIDDYDRIMQVIIFDWEIFQIKNEIPGSLSKENLKKITKILLFLVNENNQWPIISNNQNHYVPVETEEGKIGIGIIQKNKLEDYLEDIELEAFWNNIDFEKDN